MGRLRRVDFRFGSKAALSASKSNFRSAESGLNSDRRHVRSVPISDIAKPHYHRSSSRKQPYDIG
jgi:hypothetical protein